jgi:hypothetical protein
MLLRQLGSLFLALALSHASCGAAEHTDQLALSASKFKLLGMQVPRAYTGKPTIDALLYQADAELLAGDNAQAIADYRQALTWMQSKHTVVARADTLGIVGSLIEPNDPAAAAQTFREAISLLQSRPDAEPYVIQLKRALTVALIDNKEDGAAEAIALEIYLWAKQEGGDLDLTTIASLERLTETLYNQFKYREASDNARELLRTAEQALGGHHWEVARAAGYLGAAEVGDHRYSNALSDLARALSVWDEYPDHPAAEYTFVRDTFDVAGTVLELSLDPKIEGQLRFVFALCDSEGYAQPAAIIGSRLGRRLILQYRWADAEEIYQKALPWADKANKTPDKTLLYVLNGLGTSEFMLRRLSQAELHLRRAVALAAPAGNSPELAGNLDYLSRTLAAERQYTEAMQVSQTALKVTEAINGTVESLAEQLETTAMIHIGGDNISEAIQQLQRVLQLREQRQNPISGGAAAAAYWIALESARLNQLPKAETYARRALDVHIHCCGDDTHDEADDSLLLAHVLSRRNHRHDTEAESLLRKAIALRTSKQSKSLVQAQLFLALFLVERHRATEARGLLNSMQEPQSLAEDDLALTPDTNLQRHEEALNWQREASRYCSTASDSASAELCKTLQQYRVASLSASNGTSVEHP